MSFCTYITANETTGQYYIGKSDVKKIAEGYQGSGTRIARSLKKYPGQWKTSILWEFETSDEAYSDEAAIVNLEMLADPLCLNLAFGGKGGATFIVSDEVRKKISDGVKRGQKPWTDERRQQLSDILKNRDKSIYEKVADRHRGKSKPPHSDECKKKISEKLTGRPLPQSQKDAIGKGMKGRVVSPETRKKHGDAIRAYYAANPEAKSKIWENRRAKENK